MAVLTATLGIAACDTDDMLSVEDPETVNEQTLEDPDLLDVVVAGAIGNFTTGYSGGGDAYLAVSAVMTDEFHSSGTFPTRTATDRRSQQPPANGNTSDAGYNGLQRARRALKDAAAKVEEFEGTSGTDYAELKALEAYTYVTLAEGFCGAVPISYIDEDGEMVHGEPQSAYELLADAVPLFDDAAANATGSAVHLAAIGKARALLNSGDYDGAAAAVAGVGTDFTYHLYHSDAGASNPIFSLQANGRYSVSDVEGGNGLPFRSANDPRAPWFQDPDDPVGFDDQYDLYKSLRYVDNSSPVILASGVEARLIEAEAALNTGGDWLGILNDLRANVVDLMTGLVPHYASVVDVGTVSLPDLVDPGTFEDAVDLIFYERGMWLYLTGHRLGDLRRLVREYDRDQADVYPSGNYHKGGSYGGEIVFPLDFDEANNTNFDWEDHCDLTSPF